MKVRTFLLAAGSAALLLAAGAHLLHSAWPSLLETQVPMARADAIIVLGGEAYYRPKMAAKLYHEGVAPLVLVTGTGDADMNRRVLEKSGVPEKKIIVEAKSCSTLQNADFSRPIIESNCIKRALLVTSPFHARRALATFRKRIPGTEFGVVTPPHTFSEAPQAKKEAARLASIEVFKTLGYWLIYGIPPTLRP